MMWPPLTVGLRPVRSPVSRYASGPPVCRLTVRRPVPPS